LWGIVEVQIIAALPLKGIKADNVINIISFKYAVIAGQLSVPDADEVCNICGVSREKTPS